MFILFCGSMMWNNLAFALPQTIGLKVPLPVVVFASVADGFGIIGGSFSSIVLALGLGQGAGVLRDWRPWFLTALWSTFEFVLLMRSQCAKSKRRFISSGWTKGKRLDYIGVDGRLWKKLHYPMLINYVRGAFIITAVLLSLMQLIRTSPMDALKISLTTALAMTTYITNGYDQDFTCTRLWIWHGCIGVFTYLEINCNAEWKERGIDFGSITSSV